jgi:hypothetical protein
LLWSKGELNMKDFYKQACSDHRNRFDRSRWVNTKEHGHTQKIL